MATNKQAGERGRGAGDDREEISVVAEHHGDHPVDKGADGPWVLRSKPAC